MSETLTNISQNYGALNRQPKNVNSLLQNKFTFSLVKLPECSLTCKSIKIPGISFNSFNQTTSLNPIPRGGLNLEFEDLELTFLVDEDLNNYLEIANWMRLAAMVKSPSDYSKVQLENLQPGPDGGLTSDAQIILLTNESVPNIIFYFRDAFPIYLSEIVFTNDTNNTEPVEATCRMRYTYYDFDDSNSNTPEPN